MSATHEGSRLYKTPNQENDWSDVTEVYVRGIVPHPFLGELYVKLWYHGRKKSHTNMAILETLGGHICAYDISWLRFKR